MINRILTRIPQVKLRGLGQATQRAITSPRKWREAKITVQATAGRSFEVLKYNFSRTIGKLLENHNLYKNGIIADDNIKEYDSKQTKLFKKSIVDANVENANTLFIMAVDKEVKIAFRKAYMFGLKASGLTLYQGNLTFKKVSLPTLDAEESSWLNQTIFEKLEKLEDIEKTNGKSLLKFIEIELLRFYQYGRIVGAPICSFVYFNCDSKNPECQYMIDNSPWPREKVTDFNPCCRFKIVPMRSDAYRARLIDF